MVNQVTDRTAAATQQPITYNLGRTGLQQYYGIVYEEAQPDLMGDRGRQVIREMLDTEPIIGGVMLAILNLMRQVEWTVVPASDDPTDKPAADHIRECLDDMSATWADTISELASFLWYGWSWSEIGYKERHGDSPPDYLDPTSGETYPAPPSKFDDGKIGWDGFAIRSQDSLLRWRFRGDTVVAMTQLPAPDYIERTIPRQKSIHLRTQSQKNNPEGRSVLRSAFGAYYAARRIRRIEGIGIERDLAGFPVIKAPARILSAVTGVDLDLKNRLLDLVQNVKRDAQEGALVPSDRDENGNPEYEFDLMTAGGSRQFDTSAVITRYETRMTMALLADFIMVGHGATGSFALHSDKTDMFALAVGAWLDVMAEGVTNDAIPPLVKLNGYPTPNGFPKLVHGDIETADLGQLGAYIKDLSAAGFPLFPNPALERYLLEQASLPTPEDTGDISERGDPGNPEPTNPPANPTPSPHPANPNAPGPVGGNPNVPTPQPTPPRPAPGGGRPQ